MNEDTRVGSFMNPNVVCARPDMTVREVERLLTQRHVTGCPVVDDTGKPVGVVSQFDLIAHEAPRRTAGSAGRFYSDVDDYQDIALVPVDASDTPISEIMSRSLVSIEREEPLREAARMMRDRRVHRLLVTHKGVLVGIVSSLDLLAALVD